MNNSSNFNYIVNKEETLGFLFYFFLFWKEQRLQINNVTLEIIN